KTEVSTENYQEASGSLKNNFDKDRVQAELDLQREVTQKFSQNVQTAQTELNKSKDAINEKLKNPDLTAEQRAELEQKHDNLANLGLLLSVVSSGLSAPTDNLGGILAASASPVVAHEIGQFFKEQAAQNDDGKLTKGQEAAHIAAHAILGAAVAAAGGNDAVTSALAAGGAELATPVVSQWLYGTSDPKELTAEQKETLSSIGGLIGAGVGATTGDIGSIVSGSQAAQNAVDNNYLTKSQAQVLNNKLKVIERAMAGCRDANCVNQLHAEREKILNEGRQLSQNNDNYVTNICAENPNSSACTMGVKDSLEYNGGVNSDIISSRNQLEDRYASTTNILNVLYNGDKAEETFVNRISSIDDRANFFGTNDYYYDQSNVDVKWFGTAEDVSRNFQGLGADGKVSYIPFWILNKTTGNLYEWRSEAGNALMQGGFDNFKNLYQGNYQNSIQWDINQLQNEQKILQPIHEKYLTGKDGFNLMINVVKDLDMLDYDSRIRYGCREMGYSAGQGCKP
uniref:VENN motif pre-toxin domain-containing protein n=1 Tax=Stenoxybacter acetivorans TaxID=422441 RepID=UPI0009FFB007